MIPILDPAEAVCVLGGTATHDTVSANVTIDGSPVNLEGGKWSISGCTKNASTSGAVPNCVGSIPSTTLSLFTTVEGSKPIVDFSLQFPAENMIPMFLYTAGQAPNVTVI